MNLMDLFVKLSLDSSEFQKGIDAVGTTVKTVGASALAIGSTVGILAKKAVDSYANYEQLVGGVETLFGAQGMSIEEYATSVGKTVEQVKGNYDSLMKAQDRVMEDAKNAYMTAGLSANEYMEQATSFSASLIQSLKGDTEKASEVTNRAIIDMSDNANKMGTSMESIQNAYNGFAKQNYTMLDNLKLGYGGTKEEMQRLVKDASKMKDIQKELNVTVDSGSLSFANIVNAISVMQQSMGIAGTTAKEASSTIQGSLGMLKASWENLLTGFADENADIGSLIQNVFDSAITFGNNIIPRFEQAFKGISKAVVIALPQIFKNIPNVIMQFLPSMLSTTAEVMNTLKDIILTTLPEMFSSIGENAKEKIPEMFGNILPQILSFSESLRENFGTFVDAGLNLIMNIWQGMVDGLPQLIEYVPQIISNIAGLINDNAPKILETGIQMIATLVEGIIEAIPVIVENIPQIIQAIVDVITAFNWIELGGNVVKIFSDGIKSFVSFASDSAKTIADAVKDGVKNLPDALKTIGQNLVKGLWNGIKSMGNWLKDNILGWGKNIIDGIKGVFGVHSPSKVMANEVGKFLPMGLAKGINDNMSYVDKAMDSMNDVVLNGVTAKPVADLNAISAGGYSGFGSFNQTINVNQQIDTADELARAVRVESKYGLMRGVEIG